MSNKTKTAIRKQRLLPGLTSHVLTETVHGSEVFLSEEQLSNLLVQISWSFIKQIHVPSKENWQPTKEKDD